MDKKWINFIIFVKMKQNKNIHPNNRKKNPVNPIHV